MSIHIDSETYSSGTIYNGIWSFPSSISGSYEIIEQYIDANPIPWINSTNNHVYMFKDTFVFSFQLFKDEDFNTYRTNNNTTDIGNYILNRFNEIGVDLGNLFSVTMNINYTTETYDFTFNEPVTLRYSYWNMSDIFNTGVEDVLGTEFSWSFKNIDLYPHLYLKISESTTSIDEPDTQNAAIIFHTQGNPLIGMNVSFINLVNELNIAIYRRSMPDNPVEINNKWDLILRPVNT